MYVSEEVTQHAYKLSLTKLLTNQLVLQSNQLWQLVQDSLNSYVAFFEQYRPVATTAAAGAKDQDKVQAQVHVGSA